LINNTDGSNPKHLPLIGRPIHPGSHKYHYYASTDGFNPIKIPVNVDGKECSGNNGCNEIYDGNSVSVNGYAGD